MSGTVLVYRDDWLPVSEGFVIEPTLHFRRYRAQPIGLTLSDSSPALLDRSTVMLWGQRVTPPSLRQVRDRGFPTPWWRERLEGQVAVVHAHFGPDALSARHIAADLGVPLVVSMHGYDVTERDRELVRNALGRSYLRGRRQLKRTASLLLPVSDFLRSVMLSKGWPAERVITHYSGVDTRFWSPGAEGMGMGTDMTFVGRLVPLKGADLVLNAFRHIASRHETTRLHIVGDGPERARLEDLARGRFEDRVVFHGSQDRATVRELVRRSRVVVVPSRTAYGRQEALNLVSLEAASCAVPVVASDSGGLREAVQDRETGLLFREDDARAFAEAIDALLADEQLAQQMGRAGRARMMRDFDMDDRAQVLEGRYDELLAGT
jgi:glycosyltransferase involved in cell wall biosynthesis